VFPKIADKELFAGFVSYAKWNYIRSEEELKEAEKMW